MTEESHMAKFDDRPYDVIVFDEIYFANVRMLARIKDMQIIIQKRLLSLQVIQTNLKLVTL